MDELTFEGVSSRFDKEEVCAEFLFDAKWPDGFRCPRCNHSHAYIISTRRIPLYECAACRAQTSLIKGTVMEGSRTPLRLWFQAIFLHARPAGINALQLSRIIGVTYKTAWLICHKIRHTMSEADVQEMLSGLVRISDAVYSSRYSPFFDWHNQEQPLIIGASENKDRELIHIKIKKQCKKQQRSVFASFDTAPFIRDFVDTNAVIKTVVTRRIGKRVNRTLMRICEEAERWLAWTFRGIGPKHLQVYLDHYCYIWNRRKKSMFNLLLRDCSLIPVITYPQLTKLPVARSARLARNSGLISQTAS
ncbi:transposase [Cohnella kolymensis]|uniref:transposase n=1 Tax=Cohnella kolymensis TaxID=1590652 RepID=UPI000697EEE8|nr:transposase [Cohnella kolymensis]